MTKLYQYQKMSVKKTLRFRGRALLALEMGLGKTLVALTYLRARPQQRPALVICPASAKWVWRAEIRKHTKLTCRVLNGKVPKIPKSNRDVTIINYDILPSWKDILARLAFQVLILDECQYIKNWKAKRTRAVILLGKRMSHILALSGTPLVNRPKELYNTLHLLAPQRFPSFVPYAFRYCNRRMTPWGWDDTGASHLDELHQILQDTCMVRYRKDQVLHELPLKRRLVVPLPIDPPKEYEKAENDFANWLCQNFPNEFAQTIVAQRISTSNPVRKIIAESIVKLGHLKRLVARLKMKYVIEWVDNFFDETNEKLVVFAYHRKVIEQLQNQYPQAVVLDGRTPQKQREQIVHQFQGDDNTRLFIGQITAAGTAITLTAASTCAFAELDWVPGNHVQAEDRLHRIGQTNHVQAYYLVGRGTMEEKLCKIIQKKMAVITAVLDGEHQRNQMDVFDQLMSNYTKPQGILWRKSK